MAVVNINGSVWSSLLYDHSCCDGDQEGFLIGEVVYRETTNISDSQISGKKEEVDINITCHCPCKEPFSFYDTKGQIDQVKILSLLKSNYKNVIGFYRFRRNTLMQPSLREMALYQRLVASLPSGAQPETFVLGIFSCSSSWNLATHSYPYQLFTFGYNGFSARKVSLVNLGDTAESEYKLAPVQASIASSSAGFRQILGNYSTQLMGQDATLSGVQTIRSLSSDIHNKLQELKQRVCDTEGRLHHANQEVQELRRRAQRQRQDRHAQQKATMQPLNTNNNAGIARMPPPNPNQMDTHLPVAMETNPSDVANSNLQSQPALNESADVSPLGNQPELLAARTSDARERASSEPMESKSADPFAGLFKDMKQTLSKDRSSSFNSAGKKGSSGDSPAQKSVISGSNGRTVESREADGRGSSDVESGPSSQDGSQRRTGDVDFEDDDETQIQDDNDNQYYKATLSPTF